MIGYDMQIKLERIDFKIRQSGGRSQCISNGIFCKQISLRSMDFEIE